MHQHHLWWYTKHLKHCFTWFWSCFLFSCSVIFNYVHRVNSAAAAGCCTYSIINSNAIRRSTTDSTDLVTFCTSPFSITLSDCWTLDVWAIKPLLTRWYSSCIADNCYNIRLTSNVSSTDKHFYPSAYVLAKGLYHKCNIQILEFFFSKLFV